MNPSGFYVDPHFFANCLKLDNLLAYTKKRGYLKVPSCDRDRIQTCNRLIRSQLLYSVELRDRLINSKK